MWKGLQIEKNGHTCLQSWCCGFPSLFVPGFLQMEGRVKLQGLSSQRPSCVCKQDTNRERENTAVQCIQTQETRWQWEPFTERWLRPQSSRVSKRVRSLTAPQTETQSSWVLRKLLGSNGCQKVKMTGVWSVHWKSICILVSWSPIHSCSMSSRGHRQIVGSERQMWYTILGLKNRIMAPAVTLKWACQTFPWGLIATLEQFHDLKIWFLFSCAVFQLRERKELPGFHYMWACPGDEGVKCRKTARKYHWMKLIF